MNILELVKAFNKGETEGRASGGRVRIERDNLINFDTIIATRISGGVRLNKKYYSQTTSKLQNYIRNYCNVIEEYESQESWHKYNFGEF